MIFVIIASTILALPSHREGEGPVAVASCSASISSGRVRLKYRLRKPAKGIEEIDMDSAMYDAKRNYVGNMGNYYTTVLDGTVTLAYSFRTSEMAGSVDAVRCSIVRVIFSDGSTWVRPVRFDPITFDNG